MSSVFIKVEVEDLDNSITSIKFIPREMNPESKDVLDKILKSMLDQTLLRRGGYTDLGLEVQVKPSAK